MAPALLLLLVFRILPLIDAIVLSFKKWDAVNPPIDVGLANYLQMFKDDSLIVGVRNNLIVVVVLELSTVLSFLIAVLIHDRIPGWRFFRASFLFPAVLSSYVVGIYWSIVLQDNGPLNVFLRDVGLGKLAHLWLQDPLLALVWLMIVVVWGVFGVGVIIFLAALSHLDPELTDAGVVDGANWVQLQRHIVLPQVTTVFGFWALVVLITAFTGLMPLVLALTAGGPGDATKVIEYRLYEVAFLDGRFGYSSAIGIATLAVVIVIVGLFWVIRAVKRRLQPVHVVALGE